MPVLDSHDPKPLRTSPSESHYTGDSLFLSIVEERARKWGKADKAAYWLEWPGEGWRAVKRFGYGSSKSFTYFIRYDLPAGKRPIKIGIARFPYQRFGALRSGAPYPMTLLAVYPNELLPEVELHKFFADSRLGGEWFAPTPLLLSLVETVARCHSLADPRLRAISA